MKNTVISILILGLVCTVSGCKSKESINVNELSVANPYVQVESSSDFTTELGIQLTTPPNATAVTYFIINKRTAEIKFTIDATSYIYRASSKMKDNLAGIYETITLCEQFYIEDSIEVNINTTDSKIKYATWSNESIHYSLSMDIIMDNEYILSFIQNSIQKEKGN